MFGLKKETFSLIINEISNYKEIKEAVIFGSRAKGNYKTGSDIDIAIKGSEITQDIVDKLSTRLNQELPIPYFIDILHYENITSDDLIDHIDRVGFVFYDSQC